MHSGSADFPNAAWPIASSTAKDSIQSQSLYFIVAKWRLLLNVDYLDYGAAVKKYNCWVFKAG